MKEGIIILVSKPTDTLYNKIVPQLIRWFTQCEYHHVAVVAFNESKGELWIYESVFHGFKPTYSVKDYIKRVKKENIKVLLIENKELPDDFYRKLKSIIGTPYNFLALLLHQPIYQIAKRFGKHLWIGAKSKKTWKRTYCSEAIAYLFGHENWETWTAKDFYNYYICNK